MIDAITDKEVQSLCDIIESQNRRCESLREEVKRLDAAIKEKERRIIILEEQNRELNESLMEWVARPNPSRRNKEASANAKQNRADKFYEEVNAMCELYEWDIDCVLNKIITRKKQYVGIRYAIAIYYKETFDYSITELASLLGYTNHTTIIHALETFRDKIYTKDRFTLAVWKKLTDFYKGIPNEIDLMEV